MTIISFGSLIGAFVVPFMEKSFYKKTLMCMVSLAVGVLSGSGIFHLIPSVRCFFLCLFQENYYPAVVILNNSALRLVKS